MRELNSISRRASYGRRAASRRRAPDARVAPAFAQPLADLRAAVTRHAMARRVDGAPLEAVLAEVTDVVELAERLEGTSDELGLLTDRVRLWTLAAYVDVPELRDVPRFY